MGHCAYGVLAGLMIEGKLQEHVISLFGLGALLVANIDLLFCKGVFPSSDSSLIMSNKMNYLFHR